MNNQWRVFHLQHASKYSLRDVIFKAYRVVVPGVTHEEQIKKMNRLGGMTRDELISEATDMLANMERRRLCCLDLPEVPYIAVRIHRRA